MSAEETLNQILNQVIDLTPEEIKKTFGLPTEETE